MALRPIFYDTETTGVSSLKDRIVEIAAFDPEQDRSFVKLVNPKMPIPKEASAVHHISDEMVANEPDFSIIGKEFIEFCGSDSVLIAHNNDAFDILFLKEEFKRHSIEMPSWKFLDSLKWARKYRPDLPRHSLQSLREVYKFEANNAHRALDDVIILHKVFKEMTDDLTIEDILKLMSQPRKLQHMPFGKHQGKPLKDVPKDYIAWLKSSGAFDKEDSAELKAAFQQLGLLN